MTTPGSFDLAGLLNATAGPVQARVQIKRPRFNDLWSHYPVHMPAPDVYKLVGGQAYELYQENPISYANACALRLSRALNYGGMEISQKTSGYKIKGGDKKLYLLRVKDMIDFVLKKYGKPDHIIKNDGYDHSKDFTGMKGILIFKVKGWGDASGHVTLWNGSDCGDHCYFSHDNPLVKTTEILYWELK